MRRDIYMRRSGLPAFLAGLSLALAILILIRLNLPHPESIHNVHRAPIQQEIIIDRSIMPPPAPPAADLDDDTATMQPTGNPGNINCALYAGPLRWRRHPGGRKAPQQVIRALPLNARPSRLLPPRRALLPFASSELRLLADSPFSRAAHTNALFLRSLDQDRLFYNFRQLVKVRQPRNARPYGGWERPGAGIRGHFVGHYLSALATGAASGDASLLALAQSAVKVLSECQRAHRQGLPSHVGYLASFPPTEFDKVESLCHPGCDAWVPHYATQKLLSGLLALHTELGLPEALQLACARWFSIPLVPSARYQCFGSLPVPIYQCFSGASDSLTHADRTPGSDPADTGSACPNTCGSVALPCVQPRARSTGASYSTMR